MKKLVSFFILLLLCSSITSMNVYSNEISSKKIERIAGNSRIDTAVEVSKKGWANGLNTTHKSVIIARADHPADALAASSLISTMDAPLLLTYPDKLSSSVLSEIKRLKAKNVFLLGGTNAISNTVEKTLINNGLTVNRIAGKNRFDTAVKINDAAGTSANTTAILVNGDSIVDALSASGYSAINKIPIYLTSKNKLELKLPSTLKNVIIFGGLNAISKDIENSLTTRGIETMRISGSDRYSTSLAIASKIDSNNVILVRGTSTSSNSTDYPDAVAAAALAFKTNSSIILTHTYQYDKELLGFLNTKTGRSYVLGGEFAVNSSLLEHYNYDVNVEEKEVKPGKSLIGSIVYPICKKFNIIDFYDKTKHYSCVGEGNKPTYAMGDFYSMMSNNAELIVDISINLGLPESRKELLELVKEQRKYPHTPLVRDGYYIYTDRGGTIYLMWGPEYYNYYDHVD